MGPPRIVDDEPAVPAAAYYQIPSTAPFLKPAARSCRTQRLDAPLERRPCRMLFAMHGPSAPVPRVGDDGARRLIGVDAGKVTTSLAWGRVGDDGSLSVEGTSAARHLGEPLAPFFALYRALGPARVAGVVAAGAFGDRLTTPALAGIPEEIAQEWAVRALYGAEGALNVVRIGGSGYSVLTRDAAGRIGYETKRALLGRHRRDGRGPLRAARLRPRRGHRARRRRRPRHHRHLALRRLCQERADALRQPGRGPRPPVSRAVRERGAQRARPLRPCQGRRTGRAGRPRGADRSAGRGVPRARAGPRRGLAAGGRVRGARRPARGGLSRMAARSPGPSGPRPWWSNVAAACGRSRRRPTDRARSCSSPPTAATRSGRSPPARTPARAWARSPARAPARLDGATTRVVLGLDLGSTGSKGVLVEPASGAVLADVYRRTDGNPVEAAKRLISDLRARAAARRRWSPSA